MSREIPNGEWMHWFLGASEDDVIKGKDKFIDADRCNLKHPSTDQLWPMGVFEQPSVAEMRQRVELLPATGPLEQGCCLEVIDGIDIGKYQSQFTTEDKVMVQIASNFHCLENGSPHLAADYGGLVSNYCSDCTQGPAAAFGVPAASLYRAHYAFKDQKQVEEWGQTSERQVNLLQDVSDYCGECINGKALLNGRENPVTADFVSEVSDKVKVGLHSDCQVVFHRGSRRGYIGVVENPPFVDQVISATVCYGFIDSQHKPETPQLENLARVMLRAAYEGAYLAAIQRERSLLLLTLIGGASFRNPHNIILEEMMRAHVKYSKHHASQLRKVQLVLFEPRSAHKYITDLQEIQNKIEKEMSHSGERID